MRSPGPPSPGTRAFRAAQVRRRRLVAAAAVCASVIAAIVIVLSVGGSSSGHKSSARAQSSRAVATRAARHAHHRSHASHAGPPGPATGKLPQTHALPSSTSARFKSLMAALWTGVVQNSLRQAMPAYFPKAAYLQVKALPFAAGTNYDTWLVHDFKVDIGAAHALLGAGASSARLVAVRVPRGFAHWVQPGTCYNRVGYWEVPNARVVFNQNGQVHSFGIASMISWRGVWYVIHFGAVNHSGAALQSGVVDSPSAGPGTSTNSGAC